MFQEKVGDSFYPVSPTVFKRQKGRFVAYQTLSDMSSCENIRSFAMQSEPQSLDTELPNFQTLNFKHFIAVAGVDRVSNRNFLLNYQFDGKRFVKQGTDIELNSYVLNTLSSVYDLNPSAHELRLSYRVFCLILNAYYLLFKAMLFYFIRICTSVWDGHLFLLI